MNTENLGHLVGGWIFALGLLFFLLAKNDNHVIIHDPNEEGQYPPAVAIYATARIEGWKIKPT